jgi:hypothetical protein
MKGQERTTRIGNRSQPVDEARPGEDGPTGPRDRIERLSAGRGRVGDEVQLVSVQRMT